MYTLMMVVAWLCVQLNGDGGLVRCPSYWWWWLGCVYILMVVVAWLCVHLNGGGGLAVCTS